MFWRQRTQISLQCELENLEPHAREKIARVTAREVSVLFTSLSFLSLPLLSGTA